MNRKEKPQDLTPPKKEEPLDQTKCHDCNFYTVTIGYNKFVTTDKEKAFKVWSMLMEEFFELKDAGSGYDEPHFKWKEDLDVKITGEKGSYWETEELARRAKAAFDALKPKPKDEEE